MKNKLPTKRTRIETTEFINDSIVEWWQLFVEDYPKNRQEVLDIFDEGSTVATRERVKLFWAKLKNGFLEAEKTM
jgi:predicted RNase H-like HicB family nuclease